MTTLDIGGGANNEDDDCSEAAESNVWNIVTLLWISSCKLPLVSGVVGATLDVGGGGGNDKNDDCSEAAESNVWNGVMLLLEANICSWKLPSVSDLVKDRGIDGESIWVGTLELF